MSMRGSSLDSSEHMAIKVLVIWGLRAGGGKVDSWYECQSLLIWTGEMPYQEI